MAEQDDELEALKVRGWRGVAAIDEAFERGAIDEEGWHRAMADSSFPRTSRERIRAPSLGARATRRAGKVRGGSFLDIGCASGHLMECVHL